MQALIQNLLKKPVESNSMTEKKRKLLKPVQSRPGLFQPILSALNTPTYKLAKFIVPIFKPLTTNEFTRKNYFAEEIVDQQPDFFMGSLDVDSQVPNIP